MDNSPSRQEVEKFYDDYTLSLQKVGINIRHRTILRNLKREGLRRNSSVLEIGCGIGTVTYLLGKFCAQGKIVAVDISPQSIEIAKKTNNRFSNIEFLVSDMKDFHYDYPFDFVVLPDVLEHILIDDHHELFKIIREHVHENSVVAINIPDPSLLDFLRKKEPEKLQIIDQSLYGDLIIPNFYRNGFLIRRMETYPLHYVEGDYQWIILKVKTDFNTAHKPSSLKSKWQEFKSRLFY